MLANNALDLILDGRSSEVCELLSAFPDNAPAADGELALVFASVRLLDGDRDESAAYLELALQLRDVVPA